MNTRDKIKEKEINEDPDLMDRRKALKKMGYRALSAATMMVLLNTPQAVMATNPTNPNDGDEGETPPIWQ